MGAEHSSNVLVCNRFVFETYIGGDLLIVFRNPGVANIYSLVVENKTWWSVIQYFLKIKTFGGVA